MRAWVLVALLAGCAGWQDFEPLDAPQLHSGYTFGYDLTGTVTFDAWYRVNGQLEDEHDETVRLDTALVESVLSTKLSHGGVPLYVTLVSAPEPTVVAYRQSDLQWVPVSSNLPCDGCRPRLDFQDPAPHPQFRFPLTHGDTWVTPGYEEEGTRFLALRGEVLGAGSIQTPLGAVEVVRVRHTLAEDADVIARAVEDDMRKHGVTNARASAQASLRTVVDFAPDHGVLAAGRAASTFTLEASGRQAGDTFAFRIHVDVQLTSVMTGASYTFAPDRDRDALLGYLADAPPLPTVAAGGSGIPNGLSITASGAADLSGNGTVTFSVPAAGDVQWTLVDAAGEAEAGEGQSFTHRFTRTGPYTVQAAAGDRRGAMAVDAVYQGTVTRACPLVAGPALPCDAVDIPIGPGTPSLEVTADGAAGRLVLTSPSGTQQEGRVVDPAPGTWTARWHPLVDVAGSVEYRIDVPGASAAPALAASPHPVWSAAVLPGGTWPADLPEGAWPEGAGPAGGLPATLHGALQRAAPSLV